MTLDLARCCAVSAHAVSDVKSPISGFRLNTPTQKGSRFAERTLCGLPQSLFKPTRRRQS